jgi:uncharacterized repeat protein (TIGR03803 family)
MKLMSPYQARMDSVCRRGVHGALGLALLFLTALLTRTSQAQKFSVLYTFTGQADGGIPMAGLIQDHAGNLYGTAAIGGTSTSGFGVVFKVDPSGAETVLYSFTGTAGDGVSPFGRLVRDKAGTLYGTTFQGGDDTFCYCGTVFKLDSAGKETVLHRFTGYPKDGAHPWTGVVQDRAGNLYGTTTDGGAYGDGIVFKLDTTGKETLRHTFTGGSDGANSFADLIVDKAGNLYGTVFQGARGCGFGCGVVFKLNKSGGLIPLYSFAGTPDGEGSHAGLVRDAVGNMYGTTAFGGTHGWGTVYKLDTSGKETVLYNFTGGADGGALVGNLVRDVQGNLYGTTFSGGIGSCQGGSYGMGCGVVFKLDKHSTETVLYSFTGKTDGGHPMAGLLRDTSGNLYGTTSARGTYNSGVVFKITP